MEMNTQSELDARKLVTAFAADNKDIAELQFINDDPDGVSIESISGGLINYVFRVASQDGMSSIILKYSETKLKRNAPDDPVLPMSRLKVEFDFLQLIDGLLPGAVPKPYCLDRKYNIRHIDHLVLTSVAMQDLSDWTLLGDHIKANGPAVCIAERIGTIWATVHRSTSKSNVTPEYWEKLGKFRQVELKDIALRFMLGRATQVDTEATMELPDGCLEVYDQYIDEHRKSGADVIIRKLCESEQCLIQFDAHWNSAFVKDQQVAVFDLELAFLGHPAANVGYCVTSYHACFQMCKLKGQHGVEPGQDHQVTWEKELQRHFQQAIISLLTTYLQERTDMSDEAKEEFLSQTALFASASTLLVGVFNGFEIIDSGMTLSVRASLLPVALRLLRAYTDIRTVDTLMTVLFGD